MRYECLLKHDIKLNFYYSFGRYMPTLAACYGSNAMFLARLRSADEGIVAHNMMKTRARL